VRQGIGFSDPDDAQAAMCGYADPSKPGKDEGIDPRKPAERDAERRGERSRRPLSAVTKRPLGDVDRRFNTPRTPAAMPSGSSTPAQVSLKQSDTTTTSRAQRPACGASWLASSMCRESDLPNPRHATGPVRPHGPESTRVSGSGRCGGDGCTAGSVVETEASLQSERGSIIVCSAVIIFSPRLGRSCVL
jgi:hypothetical protein